MSADGAFLPPDPAALEALVNEALAALPGHSGDFHPDPAFAARRGGAARSARPIGRCDGILASARRHCAGAGFGRGAPLFLDRGRAGLARRPASPRSPTGLRLGARGSLPRDGLGRRSAAFPARSAPGAFVAVPTAGGGGPPFHFLDTPPASPGVVPASSLASHDSEPFPRAPAPSAHEASAASLYFLNEHGGLSGPATASSAASDSVPSQHPADLGAIRRPFDAHAVRRDFPILEERGHGRPLIWLDNAATTQKPQAVIDRIAHFYRHENSNIHRAAHALAARATDAYEDARNKAARFLNAQSAREIIFVRGATEGINLVAQSWGRRHVQAGYEIVLTCLEHHSNILPWQLLATEKGARLRVVPVDEIGQVLLDEYEKLLGPRTRLVALTHVSHALGTITPVGEMVEMAHRYGARVLVDGAQAVSHLPVDVQVLGSDFYVFSGHKVFGPTGVGVLQGRQELLDTMPPWQGAAI